MPKVTHTPESRAKALLDYLQESHEDLALVTQEPYDDLAFAYGPGTYWVLTDREANKKAREIILDSAWAFKPQFLQAHTGLSERSMQAVAETQAKMCESANDMVLALIRDKEHFVNDAIDSDGRGHFLSSYDGNEGESGNYFIYRID